MRAALPTLVAFATLGFAATTAARPIVVDGAAGDWSARAPVGVNVAIVARDASGAGELVWADAVGDARTDFADPEATADLQIFRVTGDAEQLAFLCGLGVPDDGAPPQIQIAIDLDRLEGSGEGFFAGFSDSVVSDAARWEFLVQTAFLQGGGARLLDTDFVEVAPLAAERDGRTVEIAVPWAALGLDGPPQAPLRLSVAIFRDGDEGLVADVGGAEVPDILDALTDARAPAERPNTWTEVQDGALDDWLDVWFDERGEVRSPLLIDAYVADGPEALGGEWITLRNTAGFPLNLGGFRLGDEEVAGNGEGMLILPDVEVAAGGTVVLAVDGVAFEGWSGDAPDIEVGNDLADVPDAERDPAWAPGNFGLGNDGDEILVLDPTYTILDVVPFGEGAYEGVGGPGAQAAGRVAARINLSDTDRASDFSGFGPACLDACDDPCARCAERVCRPALDLCPPDAGVLEDAGLVEDAALPVDAAHEPDAARPPRDAGLPEPDAAPPPVDAAPADSGSAPADSGADPDASLLEADADAPADASSLPSDAGSALEDAGSAPEDARPTPADAAPGADAAAEDAATGFPRAETGPAVDVGPSEPLPVPSSDDGCGCDAGGPGNPGPFGLLAIGVLLGLRRRRG